MTDAIVSLFIAGIATVAILAFAATTLRVASTARDRAFDTIKSRNELSLTAFEKNIDE